MFEGGVPDAFDVSAALPFLDEGQNVITIQAYNISSTSSDFSLIPFLTLGKSSNGGSSVPPVLPLVGREKDCLSGLERYLQNF